MIGWESEESIIIQKTEDTTPNQRSPDNHISLKISNQSYPTHKSHPQYKLIIPPAPIIIHPSIFKSHYNQSVRTPLLPIIISSHGRPAQEMPLPFPPHHPLRPHLLVLRPAQTRLARPHPILYTPTNPATLGIITYLFIYHLLFFMLLWSLIKTMVSEPGPVPTYWVIPS